MIGARFFSDVGGPGDGKNKTIGQSWIWVVATQIFLEFSPRNLERFPF